VPADILIEIRGIIIQIPIPAAIIRAIIRIASENRHTPAGPSRTHIYTPKIIKEQ